MKNAFNKDNLGGKLEKLADENKIKSF